jgi:hypothetical protein
MKLSLKKLLAKILEALVPLCTNSSGTATMTLTTGTVTTKLTYVRRGYVVQTSGIAAATGSVASGSNIAAGKITNLPKPVGNIRCVSYYGDNANVSYLAADGTYYSRNCGDDALAKGNDVALCWVYITDGAML